MHFDMATIELRIYIYNTHTTYKYIYVLIFIKMSALKQVKVKGGKTVTKEQQRIKNEAKKNKKKKNGLIGV